jgi:hypothetical protein
VARVLWFLPLLLVLGSLLGLAPAKASDDPGRGLVTPDTSATIERGLRFLARTQNADGSWTSTAGKKINDHYKPFDRGQNVSHVGVTSLAILAYLAGGHLPGRGPYGRVVDRALTFVLEQAQPSGMIEGNGTRMYSHAFATLALAEVYGMTQRPRVRAALEDSIEFTVRVQNATGGWRYVPFSTDSDMSVTVCQVVALRAARNVGLKVPQATIDRALKYVIESAYTSPGEPRGGFRYQPEDITWNRDSYSLAAAGLTTLFQAGLYDDVQIARYVREHKVKRNPPPRIADTVAYMKRQYEGVAHDSPDHFFYWYGTYYATQAMYLVGSTHPKEWASWYRAVRDHIVRRQRRLRDRETGLEESHWESNIDGTHAYATASALLILQFPLDYLPIHQR